MRCPNCEQEIMPVEVSIEMAADDEEFVVSFVCPSCEVESFAVLGSTDFIPVD